MYIIYILYLYNVYAQKNQVKGTAKDTSENT
jgi:hypothetical protein